MTDRKPCSDAGGIILLHRVRVFALRLLRTEVEKDLDGMLPNALHLPQNCAGTTDFFHSFLVSCLEFDVFVNFLRTCFERISTSNSTVNICKFSSNQKTCRNAKVTKLNCQKKFLVN